VRATTAFKRLMDLPGVTVTDVDFQPAKVVVRVRLRRSKLSCPACGFTTRARYDTRPVSSAWRHLDLGRWRLEVRADLRRIDCPTHGARTEGVPFARAGSRFTRDFEDLVGWLATTMDKTALCRLVRIDWDTTGRIIERVMETGLDPNRLDNLFVCGADEVSWRKGHSYLTLVSNNDTGRFVWGKEGKDTATLDCFFDELGEERSQAITAMSMDMGAAFEKSARKEGHATKAVICFDPFHVVQAGTQALEKVRRQVWQDLRKLPDQDAARRFKGARWVLLNYAEQPIMPSSCREAPWTRGFRLCSSAYSETLQEGEQRVWWSIPAGLGARWRGSGQRPLLDAKVGVQVGLRSLNAFVAEP